MLPFLRWAGGKRKLANLLVSCIPEDFWTSGSKFFEPFVGGGAVMLHLGDPGTANYVSGSRLCINDMNPDLICTYLEIQNRVEDLIVKLEILSRDLSKEKYLEIRSQNNLQGVDKAARFIYLNKTGFNGLWRVNSKGHYNVPWGQLKNPRIFDPETLRDISLRLTETEITHADFVESVKGAKAGDVVYFDPPYIPLSSSSSFSQYAMADFGLQEQNLLADVIADLKSKSVHVILSNSDTELTREIFGKEMNLYQIDAARAIAAKAASRGTVKEIIGTTELLSDSKRPLEMSPISYC
jgi:DNA adenine methylase